MALPRQPLLGLKPMEMHPLGDTMQAENSITLPPDPSGLEASGTKDARLDVDRKKFRQSFDREPLEFTHNLSQLDLFKSDSLCALAAKFSGASQDYFIAGSAASAGTDFDSVPHDRHSPSEALENLGTRPSRILLKRPENHDPQFRELLVSLFRQIVDLRGGLGNERVVRLESALLISSAATTTPIHFDPEIGFFSQIEGEKFYHVYSPASVSEPELERFYIRGAVAIGKVDLGRRDPAHEHVFNLGPGKGFHQPQNAPHWVQTGKSRSVSYTLVFETDATRALGRTRAFNHYQRKSGFRPANPGAHVALDSAKASAMLAVIPARKFVGRMLSRVRGR
jgi:hypothetical protein